MWWLGLYLKLSGLAPINPGASRTAPAAPEALGQMPPTLKAEKTEECLLPIPLGGAVKKKYLSQCILHLSSRIKDTYCVAIISEQADIGLKIVFIKSLDLESLI